jgi:hypothetical protein
MSVGRSIAHAIAVLVGRDSLHTQTTPEERAELVCHLSGAKTTVEIGVYEGGCNNGALGRAG